MPSGIDPTKPVPGHPASKADLRASLQAAKTELEHGGFFTQAGAGAAERPTQAKLRELHISAADFGAVGDGATDNSAALIAMRDWMRQDTSRLYRIFFPPGQYDYTNNRWLLGVPRIIVDGYGATLRNTAAGAWDENARPLNLRDPFSTTGDVPTGGGNSHTTGHRFGTAAAGADTITLTTPADAAQYSAGQRVLLHGYDHQFGGYPPNPRYFEYKVIASADSGTGEIAFTRPLDFAYDARWPEGGIADYFGAPLIWGKPRILSLERPDYLHPRFIWIRGAEFMENPNSLPGEPRLLQVPGDLVIYEDITCSYIGASFNAAVEVRRVRAHRAVEFDKLIDAALVEGSDFAHLGGSTGVNRLTVRNTQIRLGHVRPQPRHLSFTNCDIWPPYEWQFGAILHPGGWPIEVLRVEGVRVHDPAGALLHLVNDGVDLTLTVGGVGPGNAIRIPWGDDAISVARKLIRGALVTRQVAGNAGRVTAIWQDEVTSDLVIEGDWPSPPVAAEIWKWRPIQRCVDGGGNYVVGRWDVPLFRSGQ